MCCRGSEPEQDAQLRTEDVGHKVELFTGERGRVLDVHAGRVQLFLRQDRAGVQGAMVHQRSPSVSEGTRALPELSRGSDRGVTLRSALRTNPSVPSSATTAVMTPVIALPWSVVRSPEPTRPDTRAVRPPTMDATVRNGRGRESVADRESVSLRGVSTRRSRVRSGH